MIIFLFLSVVVMLCISLFSGDMSTTVSLISFFIIGTGISYWLSNKNKAELIHLLSIFYLAFLIYTSYTMLAYWGYTAVNSFFIYPDQDHFYTVAEQLGNKPSINAIFNSCFIYREHIEQEGAYFLFGTLAFIANKYLTGNTVLFQIINVSALAVLINLFIYKTLLFYVKKELAFKYTLFYLFFAYVLSFSPWLLRDIHITLLFTIAIYLVHRPFTINRLLFLILLQFITLEFRFESGIAFSFFPLLFLYTKAGNNKYRRFYYFLTTVIVVFIAALSIKYILSSLSTVFMVIDRYAEATSLSAEDSGGLGAILYRLPFGIKQLSVTAFSQISPFPPWFQLANSNSIPQILLAIVAGIAPVFWGYVVFISFINLKKYYKKLPKLSIWLLGFMALFLLANSSNINVRRIMAVYPIMYILFVYIQSQQTKQIIIKNKLKYIFMYSGLLIIYSMLKFL
ncbi:hypothetical protein [uncultured Sunxiuqinia sp.]|uniref:hypothetical protein n=1 Tax=uncultured Sunxiuqinia sp. TaxID=1573825 RepID=UPI002619E25D|nr:hypothetical protein [uncultured Sunxiuqinia sp.]